MVDFGFKCLWEQKQKKRGEGAMETDGRVQWREVGINGEKERWEGSSREIEGDR